MPTDSTKGTSAMPTWLTLLARLQKARLQNDRGICSWTVSAINNGWIAWGESAWDL